MRKKIMRVFGQVGFLGALLIGADRLRSSSMLREPVRTLIVHTLGARDLLRLRYLRHQNVYFLLNAFRRDR